MQKKEKKKKKGGLKWVSILIIHTLSLFYYLILSKLIKKLFTYEFWLSRTLQGHNASKLKS